MGKKYPKWVEWINKAGPSGKIKVRGLEDYKNLQAGAWSRGFELKEYWR